MIPKVFRLWNQRRPRIAVIVAVVASAGLLGAIRLTNRPPSIPTVEVKHGEFIDSIQFRGEVKALRSVTIAAPADAGDLQVVKMAQDGSQVKKGDSVVEFDKTKTEQDLAQYKSALKSAQAEIEQARAQARLSEEEDLTAMMKAKYEVELAKLEATKQEIVSEIEGGEAKLKLADAEQKLGEAERKQQSDRTVSKATIESKVQASQKAVYDVEHAERSLAQMTLRAPGAGMITLVQVWRQEGQAAFKAGDRAWPGAPMAELPDLSTLRVSARVDETERGRLRLDQQVNVQLDAIPDHQFTGRLDRISTIATEDFSAGWPIPRNFDLQVKLDQSDSRLRPGMTAQLAVVVDRVPDALTVPTQASFQKSGYTVAYVLHGSKFDERIIEVGRRSGDRILVVRGLHAGDKVALKDPSVKE